MGAEGAIAMNRIAAQDIYDRRNVDDGVNLYHSQGTIIGVGAMQLYSNTFQTGVDLNGNALVNGPALINNSQKFIAVGPAVLEVDWRADVVGLKGLDPDKNSKWKHDPLDPILYLSTPSNLVNDVVYAATLGTQRINSPIYIPNPISPVLGIATLPFIAHHDVTNPIYSEPLNALNQQPSPDPINQILQNNLNFKLTQ